MQRLVVSVAWLLAAQQAAHSAAPVDFQREVRPILSENCFQCHGPDKNMRMAGLRLDTRDGAFAARPDGAVIAPGNPQSSLVYQRISHEKDSMRMPPVSTKRI